jgi:hypothetical protein
MVLKRAGAEIASKTAMIVITTNISISVKAAEKKFVFSLLIFIGLEKHLFRQNIKDSTLPALE